MDPIQGDDIVSAVALAIRQVIPQTDLAHIYKNKPRQGFEYCSLFIDVLNSEQEREMRRRGQRTVFLDMRLHPLRDQDNANSWCRNMAERILSATDTIPFKDSILRAVQVNFYYLEKEQIMHIFVVYRFKTVQIPFGSTDPYLETLDKNITYGKD